MSSLKQSKRKKKPVKSTPESRFNDAMARLARFQKQNERFREDLEALVTRVSDKIRPQELERVEALRALCRRLIPFLSKKTLPEYMREELFDWVDGLLHNIISNPFSSEESYRDLETLLHQHIDALKDIQADKLFKQLKKSGHSDEDIAQAKEMFDKLKNGEDIDDIFGDESADELDDEAFQESLFGDDDTWFDEDFDDDLEDDFDEALFEEMFNAQQEAHQRQERELSKLLKATSVNKLFRRIARTIHPDLVQDEHEKQARHAQMSRLIQARDDKDIAYILSCYIDTFGSLPQDFPSGDYDKLTTLINHKIQTLRDEKHDMLYDNPKLANFHDWFSAKTPKQENQKVKRYLDELRLECEGLALIHDEITSIPSLRRHLEIRAYAALSDVPF